MTKLSETEIRQKIDAYNQELKNLYDVKNKADRAIVSAINRRDKLVAKLPMAEDWGNLLTCYHDIGGQPTYKRCREKLEEIGLRLGFGYSPDTNQYSVEFYLRSDGSKNASVLRGLNEILPHIKPIKGKKWIAIHERSLSEGGIYSLQIQGNTIEVVKTTYGVDKTLFKTKDMSKALEFIQANHWYEDHGDGDE